MAVVSRDDLNNPNQRALLEALSRMGIDTDAWPDDAAATMKRNMLLPLDQPDIGTTNTEDLDDARRRQQMKVIQDLSR